MWSEESSGIIRRGAASTIESRIHQMNATRFVLMGNNDQLLFTDPVGDGYSDQNPCSMRNENTPIIGATVGAAASAVGNIFFDISDSNFTIE